MARSGATPVGTSILVDPLVWTLPIIQRHQRKGRASGPGATRETGRLRSEPVAVRIQPGRFALASRMRISSTSASNPGASSPTMAAVRMAS